MIGDKSSRQKARRLIGRAQKGVDDCNKVRFERLDMAVALVPDLAAECSAIKGVLLWKEQEFEKARACLEDVVTLAPTNRRISLYLFNSFNEQGENLIAINEAGRFLKSHRDAGLSRTASILRYWTMFYDAVCDWVEADPSRLSMLQGWLEEQNTLPQTRPIGASATDESSV